MERVEIKGEVEEEGDHREEEDESTDSRSDYFSDAIAIAERNPY